MTLGRMNRLPFKQRGLSPCLLLCAFLSLMLVQYFCVILFAHERQIDDPSSKVPLNGYRSDQVPAYLREAFIETGYRYNLTVLQCLASVFQLHNETVNIWTHLLSAIAFWALCGHHCYNRDKHSRRNSVMLSSFCASKATVFTASFVAHTFSPACTDESAYQLLWRLDWSMICVAMLGTCTTITYFAFYTNSACTRFWMRAFGCSIGSMFVVVNTPAFTRLSPNVKCLGPLIPVPCFVLFLWQVVRTLPKKDVIRLVSDASGPLSLAIIGLSVYGSQVPERWFPGEFDFTGGSHTIHHLWTTTFGVWMLRRAIGWCEWRCPTSKLSLPTTTVRPD